MAKKELSVNKLPQGFLNYMLIN